MPESKQRSSIKTDEEGIVMKNSQVDDLRNELTAIDFKIAARTAEMVVLEKYAVCIGQDPALTEELKKDEQFRKAVNILKDYYSKTRDAETANLLRELSETGLWNGLP